MNADTSLELQVNTSCEICTLIKGTSGSVFASSSIYIYDKILKLNIIFDTSFPYNSERLINAIKEQGITPEDIDYIVLSHWHFDHCGAIEHFRNARLIMSYETYRSIDYFDKAISYSIMQKKPVEFLTDILFQKMNAHKRKSETAQMTNDNYRYFDNYSKVRAVANIIINNNKMYAHIIDKVKNGMALLVKDKTMKLSPRLKLYNLNIHTEGDLILEVKNDDSATYCVGDILEDDKAREFDMIMQNNAIALEDRSLIRHFLSPGNTIVTGHGRNYIFEEVEEKQGSSYKYSITN